MAWHVLESVAGCEIWEWLSRGGRACLVGVRGGSWGPCYWHLRRLGFHCDGDSLWGRLPAPTRPPLVPHPTASPLQWEPSAPTAAVLLSSRLPSEGPPREPPTGTVLERPSGTFCFFFMFSVF